jgi:hypothetical protein
VAPNIVAITCLCIGVLIIVWDVRLYSDDVERNSISQVVIDGAKRSSMVPWAVGFLFGLLTGHWFF